jgi:hypothetical protein
MDLPVGMKIAGALFLAASAVGFLLAYWWLFLAGQALLIAWVGAVLLGPSREA